jgi:peptide-methionine (S)-S-oxide reductase
MSLAKTLLLSLVLSAGSLPPAMAETKTAIFAGGCFWCIEKDFEHVEGVVDVVSGYTGGENDNPTYKNHGKYKHLEAVKITYDSQKVDYRTLLETYWRTVDPTDAGGQFCDRGHSYTTAVFAIDAMQWELAEATKAEAENVLGKEIVTVIRDAAPFYDAEGYHQDYYMKSPARYKYYRWGCGRNQRVEELWGEEAYKGVGGHSS